jgi:hypothetical protein
VVDLFIILLGISAAYRGRGSGFVRQSCSAIGFFGGLFFGGWLQPHTVNLAQTAAARALILVVTTLGCALIGLTAGEYAGLRLKLRFFQKRINNVDNSFGAVLNIVTLLISVWLVASIVSGSPYNSARTAVKNSHIVSALNRVLPPAPEVIASLGRLIDPNGFPDVFIGDEPTPSQVTLPPLGDLTAAVHNDEGSVLRIRGNGCGGIISGSGFVIGNGLVATNAHVVAGIAHPYVEDVNGSHLAKVIWFDPNLDFAVLKVSGLNDPALSVSLKTFPRGTPAAVMGYPGGGNFSAGPAAVLDEFEAEGRNIYGTGHTLRNVYEVHANIIPGNSGGPLIAENGQVIGVVFAESTTYNQVGYTLTSAHVSSEISQAVTKTQAVSTGSCAE